MLDLDAVLAGIGAAGAAIVRGGEAVSAFVALVAVDRVTWAAIGHPGGALLRAATDAGDPGESGLAAAPALALVGARGEAMLAPGDALVIGSTGVHAAVALAAHRADGPQLAEVVVAEARAGGEPAADLLAVVVRRRAGVSAGG